MDYCIGQILLLPYTFEPLDLMLCNGRILNTRDNPVLFSLISDEFGGDGKYTFGLPNLQGTEPLKGLNYYIVVANADYPVRK